MSVFVADGVRNFLKRELAETKLRCSASRETLSFLTTPYVENERCSKPLFFRIGEKACKSKRETSVFIYMFCKYLFSTHYTTYIHLILMIFETEEPIKIIKVKVHLRTGHEGTEEK